MDIDGERTFVDFEVIEIVDDSCPYPALLSIDWVFNNSIIVDLKKIRMTFEGDGLRSLHLSILMKVTDTQNLSKKKTVLIN
jgi:hypothetical protein